MCGKFAGLRRISEGSMYGYVRVGEGELKMREYELYRAFYCGLCRDMGRRTGISSRISLSYDATFLAIVRCAVLGDSIQIERRRCAVHPAKKRPFVVTGEALSFAACASAVLVRAKLDDTKADERRVPRLAAVLGTPVASHWKRRGERACAGIDRIVREHLDKIAELERAHCQSVDEIAGAFGALLGDVASFGTDGAEKRLLHSIGDLTGRFIYVCDACDDAAEDLKLGRYNPLIEIYGSGLCERRSVTDLRGRVSERDVLRPHIAEEIKSCAMLLLSRLDSVLDLVDFGKNPQLEGIIRNVVRVGMPGQLRRAIGLVHKRTGMTGAGTKADQMNETDKREEGSE